MRRCAKAACTERSADSWNERSARKEPDVGRRVCSIGSCDGWNEVAVGEERGEESGGPGGLKARSFRASRLEKLAV